MKNIFARRLLVSALAFLRTHPTEATRIQQLLVWMPSAKAEYHPAQ